MSEFSPRAQFRKYHKNEAEMLMVQSNERWFNISLETSLAELVCSGADDSELKGARAFITILKSLTDEETVTKLPIKSLEVLGRDPLPPAAPASQPAEEKKPRGKGKNA